VSRTSPPTGYLCVGSARSRPECAPFADCRLDHCRLVSLLVSVLELARQVLRPGGGILAKALQGEDHARFMRVLARFGKISQLKPKASRTESAELYVYVKGFDPSKFDAALNELRDVG